MIPELYQPNITGVSQTIDCGTLRESIIASWGVDWKIQAAIGIIAIISFYSMLSHTFAVMKLLKKDDEDVKKYITKSIYYLAGYAIIWMLSLWLVFVFNLF